MSAHVCDTTLLSTACRARHVNSALPVEELRARGVLTSDAATCQQHLDRGGLQKHTPYDSSWASPGSPTRMPHCRGWQATSHPSPVAEAHHKAVLGGIVLVLVLGRQPEAGTVVSLALTPPLVLHLHRECPRSEILSKEQAAYLCLHKGVFAGFDLHWWRPQSAAIQQKSAHGSWFPSACKTMLRGLDCGCLQLLPVACADSTTAAVCDRGTTIGM